MSDLVGTKGLGKSNYNYPSVISEEPHALMCILSLFEFDTIH